MSYNIYLQLQPETHHRFRELHSRLNAGDQISLAKPLGENLADMACEIIEQVFGQVARLSTSQDHESEKVIQQILDTIHKYMPWSVSFFANQRLLPLVNYLYDLTHENEGDYFIHYPVEPHLVTDLLSYAYDMKVGNQHAVSLALKAFIEVVDQGVTHLVRQPKSILKFNVVVDKTLNGVINLTTQLGYKRFDKLGSIYDVHTMSHYFEHFLAFLEDEVRVC
ncbi:hypothetical protein NI467_04520 [Acinetobacter bohemicus]|uniref:hypothetical protein n=1 Tax=Acinetobacter sp. S4397-1 TaxID=2972915 RepID=UPI00209B0BCB|nr:hypothetical protein [Acinetobacter sp. S4397-1]MCO8044618.1 hypothetical protein [Acinetobacter sp. S4397-1]